MQNMQYIQYVKAEPNVTGVHVQSKIAYSTSSEITVSPPPSTKEIDYTTVVKTYRKTSISEQVRDFSKKELFWVVIGLSGACLILLIVLIRLYFINKMLRILNSSTTSNV
jgi:hypothetical protein